MRTACAALCAFAVALAACKSQSVPPPATAPVQRPRVALEGYGIRIDLAPPFQVDYLEAPTSAAPFPQSEMLIIAHPTNHRWFNAIVRPSRTSSSPLIKSTRGDPEHPMHALQAGPEGTLVGLGADMDSFDVLGTIGVGPKDPAWTLVAGDKRAPLPKGMLAYSDDSVDASLPYALRPGYGIVIAGRNDGGR